MSITKPVILYDLDRDIHTALEMVARLDPFVYENETYGYMPDDLPKLTVGGLLMRLNRLSFLENLLSSEQHENLRSAQMLVAKVKREWLSAYTNKIVHELDLRINEWDQFLLECGQDQDACREIYPSVVEKRVMAQILADEAKGLTMLKIDEEQRLSNIDSQLQAFFHPGEFVWDEQLQPAYPQNQFAFLYWSA